MTRVRLDEQSNIQEPVLSEKRSCLKGGCFSSCGCLFMIGLLLLLTLRITWGPRTVHLSTIPESFPAQDFLLPESQPQRVTLTKATDVSRTIATATALFRLLYQPAHDAYLTYEQTRNVFSGATSFISRVRLIFITPGDEHAHDQFAITWQNIPQDITVIKDYYFEKFSSHDMTVIEKFNNANTLELTFFSEVMRGTLLVENYNLKNDVVESVTIEILVPHTW